MSRCMLASHWARRQPTPQRATAAGVVAVYAAAIPSNQNPNQHPTAAVVVPAVVVEAVVARVRLVARLHQACAATTTTTNAITRVVSGIMRASRAEQHTQVYNLTDRGAQ